jgi:hypothetical protein
MFLLIKIPGATARRRIIRTGEIIDIQADIFKILVFPICLRVKSIYITSTLYFGDQKIASVGVLNTLPPKPLSTLQWIYFMNHVTSHYAGNLTE